MNNELYHFGVKGDNPRDELYHFGVKGMHWGVRHDREKKSRGRNHRNPDGSLTSEGERYVLSSKKNMKKAFKTAFKEHMRSLGRSGDIYTGGHTGKNYDRVAEQYSLANKKLDAWARKQHDIIDKKYENDYDKWEKAERNLLKNPWFREESTKIANKYSKEFNRALLQDIGVKDLEAGEKAMKEYGLDYYVDTFNGVDRIRHGKTYLW